MSAYEELHLLSVNPWQTIDERGVGPPGQALSRGRQVQRPDMHVGVCGEHDGDPASIDVC